MAGREVPEDFAAFVGKYGRRLATACREIAGNDRVAEAMQVELLASVALTWRWRPAKRRVRHAVTRLDHLLRREVRGYRLLPAATRPIRITDEDRVQRLDDAPYETKRLADTAWQRSSVLRRHGGFGVAAAVLVLIAFALVGPQAAPTPAPPSPEPTSTPDGVTVLPPFRELPGQLREGLSPLPSRVSLDAATIAAVPLLSAAPLPRALAVAEPNRGRLMVIGDDGKIRWVDDPVLVSARLVTTSLSPAGDLIALPRGGDLLVIDVRTGVIQPVAAGAQQPSLPALVWHTNESVLVPGPTGALEVNVVTGQISAIRGITGTDVVTVEGNPSAPFVEMVSSVSAGNQRPRLRIWRTPPPAVPAGTVPAGATSASPSASAAPSSTPPAKEGDFDERPVLGPAWIGDWRGAAWSSALLYVRACSPATLRLPRDVGVARAVIGALQPNGRHAGTLVAIDSTQLEVVGFLRAQELLVAALSNGATALLGWTPTDGELALVATFTDEVRLSVADLLLAS